MSSRRLSIDRVYSSSTAAAPTAELLGEDDRDFFGELDELESGDSVTLEEVSSSGRAQSLPSDSGVDLGGDEEGVSLSELETSLQESVSHAARARSTGSSDTCEDHFIDPDLDREKVREVHSAQKCSCREQHNCLKAFTQEEIIKLRQNMMEMTNVERDMLIMGKLQAWSCARGADRQRTKFTYAIDYRTVCRENFLFAHALGDRVLRNIQEHMKQNGLRASPARKRWSSASEHDSIQSDRASGALHPQLRARSWFAPTSCSSGSC